MDCEKFESAMMDELYGELDELTSAAAKRHVAGCARCAARIGGLRATRRVASSLPLEVPSAGLEERILSAALDVRKVVPLRLRIAQGISLAGSWAMRPQTAMAAVFLVMIGTSVLLLRGKGHAPSSASVTVTEQGRPAPPVAAPAVPAGGAETVLAPTSASSVALAPPTRMFEPKQPSAAPAPGIAANSQADDARGTTAKVAASQPRDEEFSVAPAAVANAPAPLPGKPSAASGGAGASGAAYAPVARSLVSPFDAAQTQYRAGQFDEATRAFDALAPGDANAELWAARSVRAGKGCRAAVARFDHLAQRAAGTPPSWDALLEGALCYRAIGNFNDARVRLNALLHVDSHKDRARTELDRLDQMQQAEGSGAPASKAASPRARPAPATNETPGSQ